MADQEDIKERLIRAEEQIKVLKDRDDRLEEKIDDIGKRFDDFMKSLLEIKETMKKMEGAWKLATIIGAIIVGGATIAKLFTH